MHSPGNSSGIALSSLTADDKFRLQQYSDQLLDYKGELSEINNTMLTLTLGGSDPLPAKIPELEKSLFECSLRHKELSHTASSPPAAGASSDPRGIKLPKIDVPQFNGNILSWTRFWEQFRISVHERPSLSDSEKFVYLQQALKNGNARSSIDGLSQSGDNYSEAIACLKARYDRPRLIHKGHVKMILEAPPLKEGSGKELRALHDAVQQHVRALKSMGYEPSGPFITSALELKLDDTTMFEWQKHSQSSTSVPHFQDLLDFINLRAQATESNLSDRNLSDRNAKKFRLETHHDKKKGGFIGSHAGSIDARACLVCEADKHPLYACPKFKAMPHETKLSTLKAHNLCSNCLGSGHYWKKCNSIHKCKVCQKPHHTLLHLDQRSIPAAPATVTTPARSANHQDGTRVDPPNVSPNPNNNNSILSAAAVGMKHNSLLMTCLVRVKSPDGSHAVARALLDSASSATFISERLAQTSVCLEQSEM